MRWRAPGFGRLEVDGKVYERDLVFDRGELKRRRKKRSKKYRSELGHTPLSLAEDLPWHCKRLIVGTGYSGALPVLVEVFEEAELRGVKLVAVPTEQAVQWLSLAGGDTNAIVHVTC